MSKKSSDPLSVAIRKLNRQCTNRPALFMLAKERGLVITGNPARKELLLCIAKHHVQQAEK